MEMTTVKTIAVMAVIFGCFAVLYPKIFHPIVTGIFGGSSSSKKSDAFENRVPPHLRKPDIGSHRPMPGGAPHDDISRHMRGGPHPGMRAAAEMQKQANAQGSGGKGGMMTVVLPMYAIGIVIYLIYTLSKVFGGKKKQADEEYMKRHFKKRQPLSDVRYDADRKKFLYGEPESEEEEEETMLSDSQRSRKQQRELERLLFKADREKISDVEMYELKRRLLETESQMSRILQAMESVQNHVQEPGSEQFDEKENLRPTRQPQKQRKRDPRKVTKSSAAKAPSVHQEVRKGPKKKPKNQPLTGDSPVKKSQNYEPVKTEAKGMLEEDYSDDFEDQEIVEELRPDGTAYTAEGDADSDEGQLTSEIPESQTATKESFERDEEGEEIFEDDPDDYETDQSGSEESIPEEIEDEEEIEEIDDYEEQMEDSEDDIYEENDHDSDEGPTEEELLQKLNSKRANKGKTKTELVGEEDSTQTAQGDSDHTGMRDNESVTESCEGNKDLRRRRKPPKDGS